MSTNEQSSGEQWSVVWRGPHERLFVERQKGSDFARHRFRSNQPGDGAVVITTRDDARVLFIKIYRHVLGRSLIELPRGQAEGVDAAPLDTARRELLEETGYRMKRGQVLGTIYPDSGLSGDGVHVISTFGAVAVDVESAEFPDQRWLSAQDIWQAVSSGDIRDAITLAALVLWRSAPQIQSGSAGFTTNCPSAPIT